MLIGNGPEPLRRFIAELNLRGELLRVEEEVDAEYEICAFCRHAADENGPALMFENIAGYEMHALANLFGTRERIALAMGVAPRDLTSTIAERLRTRVPPVLVERQLAPVKEVVLTGDEIDLDRLPVPLWNEGDGGKYLTAGISIGEHPRWGKNAGIYRNMVRGKREIFAQIAPDHQQRLFYEDIGVGCPMAIVLGVDPLLYLAAGSDFHLGDYEIDVAGALRGSPLRVVPAECSKLEIPADAELVLETEFTGEYADEGPFNEFTGYQSEQRPAPIWRVKALTMRRDPIVHLAFAGKPPNENITFWRELEDAVAFDAMRRKFPAVSGVCRPPELGRDFWGVVQLDGRLHRPGLVRNVLLSLTYFMPRLKYIVAVDEDIDIHNVLDVFWAVSTRVDPGRDTFLVNGTGTGPIDPSSYEFAMASKLFIDATKKEHFRGITSAPPAEVLEKTGIQYADLMMRLKGRPQ